ncbi:MAG: LLM class flavin-dependent oxidoreductase [Actinomycetota bacterium]|nr:LLM class flavin-dependent oxidoreductase [Actinomycetota bacterium]
MDHLSEGRLALGVGLGAPEREEFEWLGENPDDKVRAAKLDEGLDVLTGLLSSENLGGGGLAKQAPCPAPWDGVFPVRWDEKIIPGMMREIVSYTLRHSKGEEPFDVAFGGATPGRGQI